MKIDLRSDTVTKPCDQMRKVMALAEVGDDVTGDDPTVNALEAYAADLLGKEAGIYTSSGVQANLISLLAHCARGDEYIVGQQAHTFKFEGGGAAVLGSIVPQPLDNEDDGSLCLEKVKANIKVDDIHFARTKLLCLENTFWGKPLSMEYLADVHTFCEAHGLKSHLDGARIFNAAIHHNVDVIEIAKHFDSVSVCLSKGLGAPVGSVLVGSRALIDEARRYRKMLGGGMRQVGIVAAGGMFALKNNVARLADDHQNAQFLADGLTQVFDKVEGASVTHCTTNMVFVQLPQGVGDKVRDFLASRDITIYGGDRQRLVAHLDVNQNHLQKVIDGYRDFFA